MKIICLQCNYIKSICAVLCCTILVFLYLFLTMSFQIIHEGPILQVGKQDKRGSGGHLKSQRLASVWGLDSASAWYSGMRQSPGGASSLRVNLTEKEEVKEQLPVTGSIACLHTSRMLSVFQHFADSFHPVIQPCVLGSWGPCGMLSAYYRSCGQVGTSSGR